MKVSALLTATAIVIVPAASAPAKTRHAAAQPQGYAYAPASRPEAIRECNVEAAKWRYSDWQAAQLTVYRGCMTRHGQPFE